MIFGEGLFIGEGWSEFFAEAPFHELHEGFSIGEGEPVEGGRGFGIFELGSAKEGIDIFETFFGEVETFGSGGADGSGGGVEALSGDGGGGLPADFFGVLFDHAEEGGEESKFALGITVATASEFGGGGESGVEAKFGVLDEEGELVAGDALFPDLGERDSG